MRAAIFSALKRKPSYSDTLGSYLGKRLQPPYQNPPVNANIAHILAFGVGALGLSAYALRNPNANTDSLKAVNGVEQETTREVIKQISSDSSKFSRSFQDLIGTDSEKAATGITASERHEITDQMGTHASKALQSLKKLTGTDSSLWL